MRITESDIHIRNLVPAQIRTLEEYNETVIKVVKHIYSEYGVVDVTSGEMNEYLTDIADTIFEHLIPYEDKTPNDDGNFFNCPHDENDVYVLISTIYTINCIKWFR